MVGVRMAVVPNNQLGGSRGGSQARWHPCLDHCRGWLQCTGSQRVCFLSIATGWGGLLGCGRFALALAHTCKMVRMPTLVADFAISRAVISAYPGRGAPALAVLVAVGAQLVVSSLALFDLVLFDTAVLATCGIYTLAL